MLCFRPRAQLRELHALVDERRSQAQAQAQKPEARLEDLHVWEQKKVKESKKGTKAYTYFMASWRGGGKLRNVYLGSSHKLENF